MKLTNLSLSILVALGLIACGGSDDNSNAAADNNNAGHQQGGTGGKGGAGDTSGNQNDGKTADSDKDKKDEQKSGINPERVAPDLKVPADLQTVVNSRKKSFIDRGFSDHALGYPEDGKKYEKKFSTDPANIKWTSTYNFVDEDDVIPQSATHGKGGIFVADDNDIQKEDLNAWAKGKDGRYYRVTSTQPIGNYKPDTPFKLTTAAATAAGTNKQFKDNDKISQDKVVFIANADTTASVGVVDLGDISAGYDPKKSQVILTTVSALDTNYNAYSTGQELNLSKLPVKKEIQTEEVTGQYNIINGKETAQATDDKVLTKNIKIGHIKAYNLPYSAAYVTTDASNENNKNIFNFNPVVNTIGNENGAFQVVGLQTVSLPKDGRAFYKGKSFSATTEGDVDLVADFFSDRAGIVGAVTNRKDVVKNKALPELTLNRIELTDPSKHYITGSATVSGGEAGYTAWQVTMYGLEAQEAAGYIGTAPSASVGGGKAADFTEVKEVFNTQRGALSKHSNDAQ